MKSGRFVLAALALVVGFLSWGSVSRQQGQLRSEFKLSELPATAFADGEPFYLREIINPDSSLPMVHAATLVDLGEAGLIAVWFGGTAEGDADVSLYTATKKPGQAWTPPRLLLDREMAIHKMRRYVVSLGNPVLISLTDDSLALLFVTISAGRWSGSSINLMISDDRGETWGRPVKLALGPFFNLSDLPRNPPVPLANGGWVVPIYHEFMGKFPELLWLRFEESGFSYEKSRMYGGLAFLQPTVAAVSSERAVALYRDFTRARKSYRAVTEDGGRSWSAPEATALPNPDTAVCLLRLPDGRLLCAFNDSPDNRHVLRLAVSDDGGVNWLRLATLDEGNGRDVCYPYMTLGNDGRIRMAYTYRGRNICYVEFNLAWIDRLIGEARKREGEMP